MNDVKLTNVQRNVVLNDKLGVEVSLEMKKKVTLLIYFHKLQQSSTRIVVLLTEVIIMP